MALGQHLGAEQDAGPAARHLFQRPLYVAAPADRVAIDPDQRYAGKDVVQGVLDALGTLADRPHLAAAFRAAERHGLVGAAVVTDQPGALHVDRQARIARGTGRDPAAARAVQRRRVAAAVQVDEDLAAVRQGALDRRQDRLGQPIAGRVMPQVDHADPRLARTAGPFGQVDPAIAAGIGIRQALEGGGSGSQHDRDAMAGRARHGQVASRVPEALLLLVGRVMLLVDDDDAEARQRGEHGGARADHDGRRAGAGGPPRGQALGVGHRRVERDDGDGQSAAEACDQLRREGDFRNQHHRASAGVEYALDQVQVDLGLAAAGHAIEQPGGVAAQ